MYLYKRKNNIKRTSDVIQEAIGKAKCNNEKVYQKKRSYYVKKPLVFWTFSGGIEM